MELPISEVVIKACTICMGYFVGEYMFGKRRPLYEYFVTIALVTSGMLWQKGSASEATVPYSKEPYKYEEWKEIEWEDAGVPHFPKPKMTRAYIGDDCRINEAGIAEIRRTCKEQAWAGLEKHADLYYYYVDILDDLAREQRDANARHYANLIFKGAVLTASAGGGFAQFAFTLFVELAGEYKFRDRVDNYKEMETCAKWISWHGSCAKAHADWCNEHGWGTW